MFNITLTRDQVYDRVWITPTDTLARELGLSDRGLGKVCARYKIPVPPRGRWAKKAAGKRKAFAKWDLTKRDYEVDEIDRGPVATLQPGDTECSSA